MNSDPVCPTDRVQSLGKRITATRRVWGFRLGPPGRNEAIFSAMLKLPGIEGRFLRLKLCSMLCCELVLECQLQYIL